MFFYPNGLLCRWNSRSRGLCGTEEVSCTTQLQVEVGIVLIVWICEGKDITSNCEVKQPDPLQPLGQRGINPETTGADK